MSVPEDKVVYPLGGGIVLCKLYERLFVFASIRAVRVLAAVAVA
jgi:hypothetical protein